MKPSCHVGKDLWKNRLDQKDHEIHSLWSGTAATNKGQPGHGLGAAGQCAGQIYTHKQTEPDSNGTDTATSRSTSLPPPVSSRRFYFVFPRRKFRPAAHGHRQAYSAFPSASPHTILNHCARGLNSLVPGKSPLAPVELAGWRQRQGRLAHWPARVRIPL